MLGNINLNTREGIVESQHPTVTLIIEQIIPIIMLIRGEEEALMFMDMNGVEEFWAIEVAKAAMIIEEHGLEIIQIGTNPASTDFQGGIMDISGGYIGR